MDNIVYALLMKKLRGVATGVSTARYDGDTRSVVFTTNNGVELSIPMPNGLTTAQIEMISHMTLEGDAETGFYIAVDGERVGSKTCSFKTSITVGALPSGTKLDAVDPADVLEQILVAKNPPLISFTSSVDAAKVYEIGSLTDIKLDIAVTKQSYDVKKVEITSSPILSDFTKSITSSPFTYTGNMTISNTQTVNVKATDAEGLVANKSIKYEFVYPTYLGYGEADDTIDVIEEADVIAGKKLIRKNSALSTQLNSNDVLMKPMISYPKSFGELTSILDVKNGFEMISNYDKKEIEVECLDGTKQIYYCYIQKTQVILKNFEIKFIW